MSEASTPPPQPLSKGRRRLFTGLMLLVPVLFFLLLEGVLRLVGYGAAYPLFVEAPGHPEYLYQNRDVARRYFYTVQNPPTSQVDYFTAEKDSSVLRLFVQGGSTAAGYPFYYGGSLSRMLEQRLLQTFPGRPVEVVNTSMAAVNSYTLLDLADEIVAQQPDAVLIYAGHNEFYGALGVASAESLGRFPWLVNVYLRLQPLRTMQALRGLLARSARLVSSPSSGEPLGATLMERMVGEQSIPYGSSLYQAGLRQFEYNLGRLLATYQQHAIPVFVGTVASNERDQKPFISRPAPTTDAAAWEEHFRAGLEAVGRGDTASALTALTAALALDTLAADAFYARARLLDDRERSAEARVDYVAAKDRDLLRFRASEDINRIIREQAARHGAHVVETHNRLAVNSPGGIIGRSLMTEHLHPNVDGHFLLADAFYEALAQTQTGGEFRTYIPRRVARTEVLLTAVDSLVGLYRVRKLTGSWPFQPPGVVDRSFDTLQAQTSEEDLALRVSRGQMNRREAVETLRTHYQEQRNWHAALKASLALIQDYPFAAPYYLAAGNVLVRQARYTEALGYFEAASDLEETVEARRMMGSILLEQGRQSRDAETLDAATRHLEHAVRLAPEDRQSLYNLGGAYALTGRFDEARVVIGRLLQIAPDHADARRLLASLPPSP